MTHCRYLIAATLSVLTACSSGNGNDAAAGARGGRQEVVPVVVATVAQRDVPIQIRAIGNAEPYSTVTLKSQVDGRLARVHFQEGQQIKQGDLLFTIDPRPFEAALRQAEANLAQNLAEAKNAEVDAKRRTQLWSQGFVSKDEHDQAETKAAALRAAVQANQAAVENAKLRLQYCYIHSTIDGRIGQLITDEGNVVKANDTPLAVINQTRPIYVTFSVREQDLPEIRRRAAAEPLKVEASIDNHQAAPIVGELSFINNTVDTTTGTVLLKGLFANESEALWPGQFVDVALTLAIRSGAVLAPAEAVQAGQQGQYVFVVTPELSAEVRPVVTGDTLAQEVVVTKGLEPGERVVIDGQARLAPGLKVEIKNGTGSAGGPADSGGDA